MYLTGSYYRLTILLDDVRYTAELENYQSFEFMDYRRNIELGVCICSKFQSIFLFVYNRFWKFEYLAFSCFGSMLNTKLPLTKIRVTFVSKLIR